jgi:hypothetical protein
MTNNFLKNIIYSISIITITAWIIFAADLTHLTLNSWDPLTKQKWDDLLTEINTLKTTVSNLESSSWSWLEIGAIFYSINVYNPGTTWTVEVHDNEFYWDKLTLTWNNRWNCNPWYKVIRIDFGSSTSVLKTYACIKN